MAGSVANIAASRKVVDKSIAPQKSDSRETDSFPKLLDNARSKPQPAAEQKQPAQTKRPRKADKTQEPTDAVEQDVVADKPAKATDVNETETTDETKPVAQENADDVEEPVVEEAAPIDGMINAVPVMAIAEFQSPVVVTEQGVSEEGDAEGENDSDDPLATRVAMAAVAEPAAVKKERPVVATSIAEEAESLTAKAPSDVKVALPGELAPDNLQSNPEDPASDSTPRPALKTPQEATTVAEPTPDQAPEYSVTSAGTQSSAPQQSAATAVSPAEVMPVADRPTASTSATAAAPANVPQPTVEARFAEVNHPKIISSVQGTLLPRGGTMQIRLDPPELGALNVIVKMHDGLMTAQFQTSNEEATKLLSHSLNLLKHSLESQGITIDKLQVQQAPRDMRQDASTSDQQRDPQQQQQQNDEQQRREMLRRMWRRLANGSDPLDLVA